MCQAYIWIPILSSVSLTSESSASVRSSKGKLQLGEIRPIERTQRERRRIVIVTIVSRYARLIFTDDKMLFIVNTVIRRGRQTCGYWGGLLLLSKNRIRVDQSARDRPAHLLIDSRLDSLVVCVRLLVCKMLSLWRTFTMCLYEFICILWYIYIYR